MKISSSVTRPTRARCRTRGVGSACPGRGSSGRLRPGEVMAYSSVSQGHGGPRVITAARSGPVGETDIAIKTSSWQSPPRLAINNNLNPGRQSLPRMEILIEPKCLRVTHPYVL